MAATTRQHVCWSVHPGGRYRGLAIVIALHLLVLWLLVTGTARKGLELTQEPPQAVLIQQVFIPPPPPPVPPKNETRPLDAKAAAPMAVAPPRAPPPVVVAPEGSAPATAATPAPVPAAIAAPAPVQVAPVTGSAPPVAPAAAGTGASAGAGAGAGAGTSPATAAPITAAPAAKPAARPEIGVACPTQVKPVPPPRALKDGVSGVVRAQALIRDGVVREVTILSGPRIFHNAVREAMLQYKCVSDPGDHLVPQDFVFNID